MKILQHLLENFISRETDATEDIFFDIKDPSENDYLTYFDDDTSKEEMLKFYDPTNDIPEKDKFGKAIP